MQTISYTAARSHLARTMQEVCENHSPIVVTRSKAEPVVILSLSDFEEMQETNYLMKNPANMTRLSAAINEIEVMIAEDSKKSKK